MKTNEANDDWLQSDIHLHTTQIVYQWRHSIRIFWIKMILHFFDIATQTLNRVSKLYINKWYYDKTDKIHLSLKCDYDKINNAHLSICLYKYTNRDMVELLSMSVKSPYKCSQILTSNRTLLKMSSCMCIFVCDLLVFIQFILKQIIRAQPSINNSIAFILMKFIIVKLNCNILIKSN